MEQQAKLQKQKDAAGDGGDGSGDGSGGKTGGDEGDGDGKNKNLLTDGGDENKGNDADDRKKKRARTGPLVPDTVIGKKLHCVKKTED